MVATITYALEAFKNPKFLTLTFNTEYLPKIYYNATDAKIAEVSIMAVRHNNAWKNFRKHVLDKLPCWVRVTEFGSTGRTHIHLAIDDPDDLLPLMAFKKHESFTKFQKLVASNPKAKLFYEKIYNYGFGIFNCEKVFSSSGLSGYLAGYMSKPLPKIFVVGALRHFRTYGLSRKCKRLAQLPKRHCYKMNSIMKQDDCWFASEIPLPPTAMIHDFDKRSIRIQDYEFQYEGMNGITMEFLRDVKSMFNIRRLKNNARQKIYDSNFTDFWSQYTKQFRNDVYFQKESFYLSTVTQFLNTHNITDPSLRDVIISYVVLWYHYYYTLSKIRSKHDCTATIRFLQETITALYNNYD